MSYVVFLVSNSVSLSFFGLLFTFFVFFNDDDSEAWLCLLGCVFAFDDDLLALVLIPGALLITRRIYQVRFLTLHQLNLVFRREKLLRDQALLPFHVGLRAEFDFSAAKLLRALTALV